MVCTIADETATYFINTPSIKRGYPCRGYQAGATATDAQRPQVSGDVIMLGKMDAELFGVYLTNDVENIRSKGIYLFRIVRLAMVTLAP